jgi:N-acetylneuraminic acid mutarotase
VKALACALVVVGASLSACTFSLDSTGTWVSLASTPAPLDGSLAVAVPGGKVLFVGGFDPESGLSSHQVSIFDPASNRWSQGAAVPLPTGFALTALSDGSVLIAGGSSETGDVGVLAASWLYDPKANTWRKVGDLKVPVSGATAVQLADGRVLIAGGTVPLAQPVHLPDGSTSYFGFTNTAEVFDPQTAAWTLVGPMHVARGAPALVALPGGKALVAGGCAFATQRFDSGGALASSEVFDPATGGWAMTGSLPSARCGADGVMLHDGRVLLVGGSTSNFQQAYVNDAVLYEAKTGRWSNAGSVVSGASQPSELADGRVFVAAVQVGQPNGHLVPLIVGGQIFDPASGDWSFVTSTAAVASFRPGIESSRPVAVRPEGGRTIFVSAAGDSFVLDPLATPPPGPILTSSRLALLLGALAIALGLLLASQLFRRRFHDGGGNGV